MSDKLSKEVSLGLNMTGKLSKDRLSKVSKLVAETTTALLTHSTKKAAAASLSISREALDKRIKSYPEIVDLINNMPKEALMNLKRGSVMASEALLEGLEDKDPALRYDNAKDILDRVGLGNKGPTIAIQNNSETMSIEFVSKEQE